MRFSVVLLLVSLMSVNSLSRDAGKTMFDRREAISKAAAFGTAGLLIQTQPSSAAANMPPTKEELERIRIGYKEITYLLENFEQETTTCRYDVLVTTQRRQRRRLSYSRLLWAKRKKNSIFTVDLFC